MASTKEKKTITLKSLDCEEFKVEEVIAKQSKMIYIVINNDIVEDALKGHSVVRSTPSSLTRSSKIGMLYKSILIEHLFIAFF